MTTRGWHRLQESGGLTHEQEFLITAIWRDVHGKPPLPPVNRAPEENQEFAKANPERYKALRKVWAEQRKAARKKEETR